MWMRAQGYLPHRFLDVKRWVIAPTIFNKSVYTPGNQLLEADIVYIRDPMRLDLLSDGQIVKLAMIAHYCLQSVDLCIHLLLELTARGAAPENARDYYCENMVRF